LRFADCAAASRDYASIFSRQLSPQITAAISPSYASGYADDHVDDADLRRHI